MNRLHSISGFWRNDQPVGLGITLRGVPEALVMVRNAILAYDEPDDKQTEGELLAQLAELAQRERKRVLEEDIAALMVINLLEHRGVIEPDEYNGMQWMWIEDHTMFVSNESRFRSCT